MHVLAILNRKIYEIDSPVQELREFQEELVQLRDESAARAERSTGPKARFAASWSEAPMKRERLLWHGLRAARADCQHERRSA